MNRCTRVFQQLALSPGISLRLDDQASHHLSRVLRVKTGDSLVIFNGEGGEYDAVITQIDKKSIEVKIGKFNPREAESPLRIHLAQALARGEKMDFIVQKAVELGVNTITPLLTSRCNVRLDQERGEKRLSHWQSVMVGACEQSGRNRLPLLERPVDLKAWLPQVKGDYRLVLSPHADKKWPLESIAPEASIILLIGPEGGLSDEEVALSIKNGFILMNLGKRVLRTETASLAALAALQARFGDFFN